MNKRLLVRRAVRTGLALVACAIVVFAAESPRAASLSADAVRALEAVGANPGKLKKFCDLMELLNVAGDQDDPDVRKEVEKLVMEMSPEYGAAMQLREKLDAIANSPDVRAIDVAVETLDEKCPPPARQ